MTQSEYDYILTKTLKDLKEGKISLSDYEEVKRDLDKMRGKKTIAEASQNVYDALKKLWRSFFN
jgi:hypothetical protein